VSRFKKTRKAILNGAVLLCALTTVLRAVLEMIYFDYPRRPDPATGRTVPHEVKNVIIYITESLSDVLSWLQWSFYFFGALLVISVILDLIWPVESKRQSD
jgi:hypothetical protein